MLQQARRRRESLPVLQKTFIRPENCSIHMLLEGNVCYAPFFLDSPLITSIFSYYIINGDCSLCYI